MLRIAICDDEESARDALRIQLEKIMDETEDEQDVVIGQAVNTVCIFQHKKLIHLW